MELRQLKYVDCVARYKNFSKAANELHITQQTLSQQIMKFEEEIGFSVFERSTRSVKLSDRGSLILQTIRTILAECDSLSEQIDSLRFRELTAIQLGMLPTFSSVHALEAIHEFQSQCKGVTINIQIHRSIMLLELLSRGKIDAAIANISFDELDTIKQRFFAEPISNDHVCAILNGKNPLARKKTIKLSDLDHRTLLLLDKESSIRNHAESLIKNNKISPRSIIDCTEIYSMIELLHTDAGIGFLSSKVAKQYLSDNIKCIAIDPPLKTYTALVYSKNSPNAENLRHLFRVIQAQDTGKKL